MKSSPASPFLFHIGSLRVQDVVVVFAFLLGVFVFRVPDSYDLNPTWRLEIQPTSEYERNFLPQPIITDLDSDGINEFTLTTGASKIQIMAMPPRHSTEQHSLPHLHLKAESQLESVSANSSSPLPVALASGCLKNQGAIPYESCHQVIVVVTHEGDVLCYNHHLQLQWKTRVITESLLTNAYFKEATALVSPRSLDVSDQGLVVVGVRLGRDQMQSAQFRHGHQFNSTIGQSAEDIRNAPPPLPVNQSADSNDHFSTYALDGKTGNLKWKHEPGDFVANISSREGYLSSHHFNLALPSNQHHTSEVHWSQYARSLVSSLPYRWQYPSHTKLHAAYFEESAHNDTAAPDMDSTSFDLNFLIPGSIGTQPETNTATKTNALVVHNQEGIEVLSLLSGQPLCRYKLVKETHTLGDVNNDGVIDHVTSHFAQAHHLDVEIRPCSALVMSNSKVLFTGSICEASWLFGSYFASSDAEPEEEPLAVAPLLVRSPAHRSGVLRHLMGHNVQKLARSYDSVFLTSAGKATSFGPHGELNWQVKTDAHWKKQVSSDQQESRATHVVRRGGESFVPDVEAVATKVGGAEDAVLVSGWSHFAMLSLRDGSVLSSHSLPCQPVSPVIQGDFTNDGLTDFVVHCRYGYLGFALSRHPGHWWTILWSTCVLGIALVAVCVLRFIEEEIL